MPWAGYDSPMRFRTRVEVLIDTDTLEQAQAIASDVAQAAFEASGAHIVPEPDGGSVSRTDLEAADDGAAAAFAAEGLGPGISSSLHLRGG